MATGAEERNALTIHWKIENFSCFETVDNSRILSPHFNIDGFNTDTRCCLTLNPRDETQGDMNIILSLYVMCSLDYTIDIEFSLLHSRFNCDGSLCVTRTLKNKKLRGCSHIDMPDCVTHNELKKLVSKKTEFLIVDTLTVKCCIWKSTGNFDKARFSSICTRIEAQNMSIERPIERIPNANSNKCATIPVKFNLLPYLGFRLNYSISGGSLQNSVLGITLVSENISESLSVKLIVSILSERRKAIKLIENKHTFLESKRNEMWTLPNLVFINEFREKMSELACCQNLSLLFHFTVVRAIHGKHSKYTITSMEASNQEHITRYLHSLSEEGSQILQQGDNSLSIGQQRNKSLDALSEDFQYLHREQVLSDFSLCAERTSFPVHKAVLIARSPVFRAMLSSDMKESFSDSVDISDLDASTLDRMLGFLYSGTLETDMNAEDAARLYYAGDKYQVESLKWQCSLVLESKISVSNVSEILTLAHKHENGELKMFVDNFIRMNYDEVMHSDEWESFLGTDPYLAGITMHQLYKKRKICH